MTIEADTHPLCPLYNPDTGGCLQQAKLEEILATIGNNPALKQALESIKKLAPSRRSVTGLCLPILHPKTPLNNSQQHCSFRETADALGKVFLSMS